MPVRPVLSDRLLVRGSRTPGTQVLGSVAQPSGLHVSRDSRLQVGRGLSLSWAKVWIRAWKDQLAGCPAPGGQGTSPLLNPPCASGPVS